MALLHFKFHRLGSWWHFPSFIPEVLGKGNTHLPCQFQHLTITLFANADPYKWTIDVELHVSKPASPHGPYFIYFPTKLKLSAQQARQDVNGK
eukprot:990646-Pelagomonas_calceolata.AAC.1